MTMGLPEALPVQAPAAAPAGTVVKVHADPTDGGIAVHVEGGSAAPGTAAPSGIATGQAALSTSAQALSVLASGPSVVTASGYLVRNLDAAITIYVGGAGVTSGTGFPVLPGEVSTNLGQDPTRIFLVAASGTPSIAWEGGAS